MNELIKERKQGRPGSGTATKPPKGEREPVQKEPINWAPFKPYAIAFIVLAFVVGGGFGPRYIVVVVLPERRRREEERQEGYREVAKARQEAEAELEELRIGTVPEILKELAANYEGIGADGDAIEAAYNQYVANAALAQAELDEGYARADLNDERLKIEDLEATKEDFEQAEAAAEAADDAADER